MANLTISVKNHDKNITNTYNVEGKLDLLVLPPEDGSLAFPRPGILTFVGEFNGLHVSGKKEDLIKESQGLEKPVESKVLKLMDMMSVISVDGSDAGWCSGVEHSIWHMLTKTLNEYQGYKISDEKLFQLRVLSEEINGWIYFDSCCGETYIGMSEWLEKHEKEFKQ